MFNLEQAGKNARLAQHKLSGLDSNQRNNALEKIADLLTTHKKEIILANEKDLDNARQNNMSEIMIDRLMLNEKRIEAMAQGVRQIITLDDPIGCVSNGKILPNGLFISTMRVSLGVIGIIYESRPNVTVDAAALCLKAGNCVILKGGKEAINSNIALGELMRTALKVAQVPEDAIIVVSDTNREITNQLMRANEFIDVLIPRGGAGLISTVVKNSTVPVIETGTGNCHIYVDKSANLEMAVSILVNAKTSRPSVCNAAESLLIDKEIADNFLPIAANALVQKGVTIYGCEKTKKVLKNVLLAKEDDYYKEYLDLTISIKVVDGLNAAIDHINTYSTHHSEAIITQDYSAAERFLKQVDSAAVYVNASTRFTDGFEFGLGAEIGISTQKLHARGPMGLKALTCEKYVIRGNGQIR